MLRTFYRLGCIGLLLLSVAGCGDTFSTEDSVDSGGTLPDTFGGEGGGIPTDIGDTPDTGLLEDTATGEDTSTDAILPSDITQSGCASHEDCDDGIECTVDLCTIEAVCSHEIADALCLIDAVCHPAGGLNPENECQQCDPVKTTEQWTPRQDVPCDDGNPCTVDSFCNKEVCEGTPVEACCGNGIVDPGETCDGDCPEDCTSKDPCFTESLVGTAESCDAECLPSPLTVCTDDDGCCPANCGVNTDSDCAFLCGNGIVDPGETCDGDCLTECPTTNPCSVPNLLGSPETCDVACISSIVTACADGDGCCPKSCTLDEDSDCQSTCGNGIVEPGETCDGDCPSSCPFNEFHHLGDCNWVTIENGGTCNAECVYYPITECVDGDYCCAPGCSVSEDDDCGTPNDDPECGNGFVEDGELCDGDCPTSCQTSSTCFSYELTGSPTTCDSACVKGPSVGCVSGDGCCPGGCNPGSDSDCSPTACELEINVQCVEHPSWSAEFQIQALDSDMGPGGLAPHGYLFWSANWPDQELLPNWCLNDTGLFPVQANSSCIHATYEIGTCLPLDYPKTCETTFCYQCP